MSTITTITATFTADQAERLESCLISYLDSGMIPEDVAMALNGCTDANTLRVMLNDHVSPEIAAHIINVVMDTLPEPVMPTTVGDLSEFFQCNTPEEARNLQSWSGAFGVEVKPNLSVVTEEKPMKKKELTAAEIASRQFKAIVEDKARRYTSENIVLDDIERKSSGFIATSLAHALEKTGFYTQTMPSEEERCYSYAAAVSGWDNRLVAMLAVQLAGVLPYLDQEYDMEHVVATAVFRRRFRDIARANSFISGAYHPSMDAAGTTHWHEKLRKGLELAIKAGLVETREEDGVTYIKHTLKYIGSCVSRTSIMHQTNPIEKDTRRKERVKGRANARRDGTSAEVREAMSFIESQAQCVNTWLLDAINEFTTMCSESGLALPAVLQESSHVIFGANQLRAHDALYSEYFQDLRGRMYQFAHCGPNPQASDTAKALCYHTVPNVVKAGTQQHQIFLNEMFGEVVPKDSVWAKEAYIRRTAEAPAKALHYAFLTCDGKLPFKKFFSYMDMCRTWVDFEDKGEADSRLGFGPDAKCSGAQIFSILAGCKDLAEACGLVTGYTERPADPYKRSALCVNEVAQTVRAALQPNRLITRDEIKVPFMAIQYGGGVPALRYKKFEPTMDSLGIDLENRDQFCKKVVIEGIQLALGEKVGSFIEGLREAVAQYCETYDVDYFEYRHIDGFKVTKRGEAEVMMTAEPFIINYGREGQGVIFGSLEKKTGWFIESRTTGLLQRQNFIHYFPVHFIQGLDAVMARKIALGAKKLGLRGYSTIHDQFRVCLEDAPALREKVIPEVYMDMFVKNDPVKHLAAQIGTPIVWGNPLEEKTQVVTEEIVYSTDAYYFE